MKARRTSRALRFYRREKRTIGLVVAALAFILVFWWIADAVMDGTTSVFDRNVTLALQHPANPVWLKEVARDITSLGSFAVLGIALASVVGYLLLIRKPSAALFVLFAVIGGAALNSVLKTLFARARPDILPHGANVFTASFPSGHAAISAIAYLTLAALLARTTPSRRLRYYYVVIGCLLAFMVGATRVYLGVHYPTDVLAGWCIGGAWAFACWSVMARLQGEGRIDPPGQPRP